MRDTFETRIRSDNQINAIGAQFSERARILSILERTNRLADLRGAGELIDGMLDLLLEITQADSANYLRLDENTDELVVTAMRGDADSLHLLGLRVNRQEGLPGIVFQGAEPVVIGDLPADPAWLSIVDPVSAARKRNVINLPVTNQQHKLGVIQIFNYQQAELDLLQVLANRLASELDQRRQVTALHKTNQRLNTLIEVLGEVAGTLDRNQLLHLVAENASRLVNAERSSVFLVDPGTNEMIFQVAYRSSDLPVTPKSPTTGLISRNQTRQRSVTQPGQNEFSFFSRSAITVPIHSEPLEKGHSVDRRQVLGGLMALNKPEAVFQEEDAHLIQILANQASTFLQVAEMYESAGDLFLDVIKALAAAIDAKDPHTQGHSQRVSDYSVLISQELQLQETEINDIRIGSLLHDIGKIGIPDSILLKGGRVTPEERVVINRHPITGVNILSRVKLLEPVLPAIAEHHERLDGSGYPANLTDRQISLMGRIVAVADVFDAMTSNRPYRRAMSVPEVLAYLRANAGILFDRTCVEALDRIINRANELT